MEPHVLRTARSLMKRLVLANLLLQYRTKANTMNEPIKNILLKSLASSRVRHADIKPGDNLHDLLAALGLEPNLTRVEHNDVVVSETDDLYSLLDEGDQLSMTPHMDGGQ